MMRRFNAAIPWRKRVGGGSRRWSPSAERRASALSMRLQPGLRKNVHGSHRGLVPVLQAAEAGVKQPSPRRIATDTLVQCNLVPVCAIRGETVIYMNERCAALFALSRNELDAGVPLRDVVAAADWPRVAQSLRQATANPHARTSIAFSAVRKDGSLAEVELACAVAPGRQRAVLVSVVADITDRARAYTQLSYLAFNDALTGLPNRALFFDRLRQTLVAARRSGHGFALLACDLDDFKTVNDTCGHEAGDAVLQVTAERLRSCCREEDTAARIGGDEFVVIVPGVVERSHAVRVAGRIIAALGAPVSLGGHTCSVGASVGIAFYPQDGQTIETLFRSADAAMYASKTAGKSRFSFADPRKLDVPAPGRSLIAWSDVHGTGIGVADAQHRQLAAMIDRLGADLAAGEDIERVRASFETMIAFAQSHFATEEALMDAYAIEDRVAHKQMHRKLLQDVRSLATGLDESSMALIMGSLHEWLLRHIESADRSLASQLRGKGYLDTQG